MRCLNHSASVLCPRIGSRDLASGSIFTERTRIFLPSKAVIVSVIVAKVSGVISSAACALLSRGAHYSLTR